MLRLVLISLVAAAVVARPTFPDLHQNEKSEAIEISKVTEFKPGEEPKQSTDVRLIKDGQAIPIERQQRRALNPEIKNQQSNVQQPGEDSQLKSSEPLMDDLQESKRQALDVDLRGPQDPSAQSQLESGQRQLQSENEESLGLRQQRMQDIQRPDDQQLPETTPAIEQTSPSSDKEEERDDGIARISLFRTIIVILSHKMSPVEDEQLLDSLQPEKQPELEEPLNAEVEKQPDINSGVLKRRQLRQQGPPLPPLPPQSSFVEIPAGRQRGHESIQRPVGRQWEQSELEPPVMMQKRDVHQKLHQERLDQQGQPSRTELDEKLQSQLPRQRRNIQPQMTPQTRQLPTQKHLDQQQVQQPGAIREKSRHTRDIFQPASTIPKASREQQKVLQDRPVDLLPLNPGEKMNEPPEQRGHIHHEPHHMPGHRHQSSRRRRDEPFPSVLIPPRLVEQKENIQKSQGSEEMKGKEELLRPEEPEPKQHELPEQKEELPEQQRPELEKPERTGKEHEEPFKEQDFKKVLDSTPSETMDKAKEKGEGMKSDIQPAMEEKLDEGEEKLDEGEEKLGEGEEKIGEGEEKLGQQMKPEHEHPVSGMMEKGKEGISDTISEAEKPVEKAEDNIQDLPESVKESMPDTEKPDRKSQGKSLDIDQLSPNVGEESRMHESVSPDLGKEKESISPDQGGISPDAAQEHLSPVQRQDVTEEESKQNIQSPGEEMTGETIDLQSQLEKEQESNISPLENTPSAGESTIKGQTGREDVQETQQPEALPDPVEVHSKHQQQEQLASRNQKDEPTSPSIDSTSPDQQRNKRTIAYPGYYRRRPYYRRYGYPYIYPYFFGLYPGYYGGYYGTGYGGYDESVDMIAGDYGDYGGYDYGGGGLDYGGGGLDYGGGGLDYGGGGFDYGGGGFDY